MSSLRKEENPLKIFKAGRGNHLGRHRLSWRECPVEALFNHNVVKY
jgi:hypothetical protein